MLPPIYIMSWEFSRELTAKKMNRGGYDKWKRYEEEAQERSKKLRGENNARS